MGGSGTTETSCNNEVEGWLRGIEVKMEGVLNGRLINRREICRSLLGQRIMHNRRCARRTENVYRTWAETG